MAEIKTYRCPILNDMLEGSTSDVLIKFDDSNNPWGIICQEYCPANSECAIKSEEYYDEMDKINENYNSRELRKSIERELMDKMNIEVGWMKKKPADLGNMVNIELETRRANEIRDLSKKCILKEGFKEIK